MSVVQVSAGITNISGYGGAGPGIEAFPQGIITPMLTQPTGISRLSSSIQKAFLRPPETPPENVCQSMGKPAGW